MQTVTTLTQMQGARHHRTNLDVTAAGEFPGELHPVHTSPRVVAQASPIEEAILAEVVVVASLKSGRQSIRDVADELERREEGKVLTSSLMRNIA